MILDRLDQPQSLDSNSYMLVAYYPQLKNKKVKRGVEELLVEVVVEGHVQKHFHSARGGVWGR